MRKGIAVPYIIAILLGVAVIGFVGYWLFLSTGRLGFGAASQQCKNDFLEACTVWGAGGYNGNTPPQKGVFSATTNSDCAKSIARSGTTAQGLSSSTPDDIKDAYKRDCGKT